MNLGDLAGSIGSVGPINMGDLVKVIDQSNGLTYDLHAVDVESDEDTGATTVWLVVEES